ncbi:MAG: TlpA disulfide reductase family protein [Bacteroides sp.]|jgi:thiol-disulfide isomerase/thioredoxin|nr:TlpA disulfide reductase family protein [Bacteroides sp.]
MKKFLILIPLVLFLGCSRKGNHTIRIAGSPGNSEISVAELKTNDSTYVDTIVGGSYSFVISDLKDNYIELKLDEWIPLYAEPGDSIFIHYDKANIQVQFSGNGFEESEYLFKGRELMKELGFGDPRMIDIALFSSNPESFLKSVDSIKQVRTKLLRDYKDLNPNISDNFFNTESLLIDYYWINQQFGYPGFYEMLTNTKAELPGNYYQFTDQVEPGQAELFKFKVYREALSAYLDHKAKDFQDKYLLAKELFTEKEMFEEIIYAKFITYINFNGTDGLDSIYQDFLPYINDQERKEFLTGKYNSWSRLAIGEKAPEFEIADDGGNVVRLSDFYGKFVYIDCWSSFCGPCLKEMPEMKKLSDEYKNENIVFISISADDDREKWLSKIKEFQFTNTVNLWTAGTNHPFNNDYNAKAFPRYILIDEKGNILDATADNPSMIKEKLEQLL